MSIVDGGKGLGKRWRLTAGGRFAEKEQQVLKEWLDEEEEQEEKRRGLRRRMLEAGGG